MINGKLETVFCDVYVDTIHSLIRTFIHSFYHSLVNSFIHSSIRSFFPTMYVSPLPGTSLRFKNSKHVQLVIGTGFFVHSQMMTQGTIQV